MIKDFRMHCDGINAPTGAVGGIEAGPADGYDGIFVPRRPDNRRVRVLRQLLSKQRLPPELSSAHMWRRNRR